MPVAKVPRTFTGTPTQTSANEGSDSDTTAGSVKVVAGVTSTVTMALRMPTSVKLPVAVAVPQVPVVATPLTEVTIP